MALNRTDSVAATTALAAIVIGAFVSGKTNLTNLFDRRAFGAGGLGVLAWNQAAKSIKGSLLNAEPIDSEAERPGFNVRASMAVLFAACVNPAMGGRGGAALLGAVLANGATSKVRALLKKK